MRVLLTITLIILSFTSIAQEVNNSKLNDTITIAEVTVSAKSAVSIKGDTVSYRIDSFNKDQLASTEDVLKKLPGIEIDEDGNILVNGKPVKYILINGKEFQVDDITTITQNLPANVIEKIQVADYHTEEEKFTGLKKTAEEKVVNLKLKKEYSSGVVGRISAGYGTKDRYQTGAFANYMAKNGSRTTLLGALSNTGVTRVSNTDDKNQSWRSPGIREGRKGSINFTIGKNEKADISGTYSYSGGSSYLLQNKARTTYLQGDSLLQQDENSERNSSNDRHHLNIRSKVDFNEVTRLETKVQLSYNTGQNDNTTDDITYSMQEAGIDFRRTATNNNNTQNGRYLITNSLMRRLGKAGRTVIVSSNMNYTHSDNDGIRINNNVYTNPYSENSITNKSDNKTGGFYSQLGIKYNEPITESLTLSLGYNNIYNKSNTNNQVSVLNGDVYIADTNQTRTFDNTNVEHRAGIDIRHQVEKVTSGVGIDAVSYNRKNTDLINSSNTLTQKGVNYAPSGYVKYNLTKSKRVELTYYGNVQTPHFRQLQPIPDYTDSLNIFIGNPDLKPQVRNRIRLRYVSNNIRGSSFWAGVYTTWEANKIINKTELTNSKRTTTPVNANGNYNVTGNFSITEPIVKNRLKISVSGYINGGNRIVILNNVFSNLKTYSFNPRVRLTYTTEKSIEANLYCDYYWNEVAAVSGGKNILRRYNISHEAYIKLPLDFRWSYNVQYTHNTGLDSDFDQSFLLFGSSIDKAFGKLKSLNLRLQIFDAFNNYPTVSRRVGDSYFEDISVNRLGRYMMFSVIYKFTSFPKSEAK